MEEDGRWTRRNPILAAESTGKLLSRIRDACFHMKMVYLNKDYAIVFLAFIGLLISREQYNCLVVTSAVKHLDIVWLLMCVSIVFCMSSGVLAYIYPPHKILAISIISSSSLQFLNQILYFIFDVDMDSNFMMYLCQYVMFIMALPAFHGIWALWIELNKLSIHHVPIVLYSIFEVNYGTVFGYGDLLREKYLRFFLSTIGLIWATVWVCVNFRPNGVPYYTTINIAIEPKLSDIPWKSMFTSMPVLAIVVSHVCETFNITFQYMYVEASMSWRSYVRYSSIKSVDLSTTVFSILFGIVLVELFPEVNVFSTKIVRKFWSCAYFTSRAIFFLLYSLNPELFVHELFLVVYGVIGVFYCFGFVVNHMDISPRYASILISIMMVVVSSMNSCILMVFYTADATHRRNRYILGIQIAVVLANSIAFVFYFVFASAELQPWAKPRAEERRQDMAGVQRI